MTSLSMGFGVPSKEIDLLGNVKVKSPKWKKTAEHELCYIITVWLVYQQLCINGSKACFSQSVVYCGYCITMLLYSLPRRTFFSSIIMGSSRLPHYISMIPSPFALFQMLIYCSLSQN